MAFFFAIHHQPNSTEIFKNFVMKMVHKESVALQYALALSLIFYNLHNVYNIMFYENLSFSIVVNQSYIAMISTRYITK